MLEHLKNNIKEELSEYDRLFANLIESDFPFLQNIHEYVFRNKGKQLRPVLLLHTHRLFLTETARNAYLAACLIEIIHAASLLHDDVVDDADLRRGKASVKALWGNKTAVLAGDYMLSNAFLKAYDEKDNRLMQFLIEVIKIMSQGELLQIKYSTDIDLTKNIYEKIIESKTAALIACACKAGAFTARTSSENIEKAKEMGHAMGMAFQIRDDLADLNPENAGSKGYGQDLKEGKISLPIYYYLAHAPETERSEFRNYVRDIKESDTSGNEHPEFRIILDRIRNSEAVDLCKSDISLWLNKASYALDKIECTGEKTHLKELITNLSDLL